MMMMMMMMMMMVMMVMIMLIEMKMILMMMLMMMVVMIVINQVVNANNGTNIATSDPAASTRITPAPAGDGTLAEGAIVVNSSDSPLSDSSAADSVWVGEWAQGVHKV